jgi:hypothetical protein
MAKAKECIGFGFEPSEREVSGKFNSSFCIVFKVRGDK